MPWKFFNASGSQLTATDNVTVAALADGTDGELITWDTAGAPATVAVGTSGHVLTSGGTGVAPTFSTIAVSSLANGTDGELITWNASGAPATVAVGTINHVLTSGGTGVAPTFQAAAGTTINSNADNRVITGSGTANTLNGESELTYTGGQITLNYDSGGAIINLDGSTGQTLVKYRNAGTTKWEIGMDADASSNQKSHVDDYGLYNGGTYGVVISGNGTTKFGIGTQAGIALSGSEIPDDGIQFPATQNANSSANNLDDYEEGTWTPLIQDHLLSDRSQAYSIQFGRYQKVGNRVHISGRVELNGLGSLTTTSGTRIAGFPFTSSSTTNNDYGVVVTYTEGLAMTANASVTGKIYTNTTYAYMFEWDSTLGVGGDGLTLAELSTDGHLEFFGSYEV